MYIVTAVETYDSKAYGFDTHFLWATTCRSKRLAEECVNYLVDDYTEDGYEYMACETEGDFEVHRMVVPYDSRAIFIGVRKED